MTEERWALCQSSVTSNITTW